MDPQEEIGRFMAKFKLRNQTEVARLLGISRATITDWHRGKQAMPLRASLHMKALIRVKELEDKLEKVRARGIKV